MARRGRPTINVVEKMNEIRNDPDLSKRLYAILQNIAHYQNQIEQAQIAIKDIAEGGKEALGLPKGFLTKTAKALVKQTVGTQLEEAEAIAEAAEIAIKQQGGEEGNEEPNEDF
ncbi:MAG TPA: hypothetical protein VFM18_24150 [Methanosarcina sp.]|nr:hypothetical protein [Methanosarcina sp.]